MLTIGKLSKATGVKIPTIRYYEQIGLLASPVRSSGNQRHYDHAAQERLAFISHARDLGFPLDAIRELLSLSDRDEHACATADDIARRQLAAVKARIARLNALQVELQRMLDHCHGGSLSDCRVIQVLGDHGLCRHDHGRAA
ncbi:MerR family transcriptional regulator [Paracoccus laeviglucosivorans]|uniref:DNA-binding transcriptional regulator, MerR family n=1 Tax=Paracoccus laeviglucosivorans TaxID=1197861 RepID=A0A521CCP4_9RHOB|nr:helix-turn-helix domain-containing protein [Paracoccus laeviglucosivorans]SMO56571.1 DNA-binding transcriptional regulator, MerR family [Paracoccus laeviglucosivorans]